MVTERKKGPVLFVNNLDCLKMRQWRLVCFEQNQDRWTTWASRQVRFDSGRKDNFAPAMSKARHIDIFLEDCNDVTRDVAKTSVKQRMHITSKRGGASLEGREETLDRKVAAIRVPGSLSYFLVYKHLPFFDDGQRIEEPRNSCLLGHYDAN